MLVVLSDSLVSVGANRAADTLLADAPWSGLYPTSSILSAENRSSYIGMRQFVGEFDIPAEKLRLLIPSDAFLNRLSPDAEQQIRELYGGTGECDERDPEATGLVRRRRPRSSHTAPHSSVLGREWTARSSEPSIVCASCRTRRPHEALEQRSPLSCYELSARVFPEKLPSATSTGTISNATRST
jgi:hypothetical protein